MNANLRSTLTLKQRQERKTGLGGSDALAYCGRDPRKTPLELYLEKTGEIPDDPQGNARMEWGSRLEPVVRDWLSEELGRRIHTRKQMYRSTELPMMIAHPDGITESPMEGVEIKCADKFMSQEFGDLGSDQVPFRYILQVTHYMIVTRLRRFHLAALLGGNDPRHYVIDYDQALAELLVERARKFWHHVESKTPPDPVNLEDTDRRWPASAGRTVIANDEMLDAVAQLKTFRKAEFEAGASADALEVKVKSYIGDAGGLIDAHHRELATWRTQSLDRFDTKRFKEAHPELAAQYRAISQYRVFRLK